MSRPYANVKLRQAERSVGSERVPADEVVPAALGAHLDFIGDEIPVALRKSLKLGVRDHALSATAEPRTEHIADDAKVSVGAQRAVPAQRWGCVAGSADQVRVGVARF